jgi:hypothetical protein
VVGKGTNNNLGLIALIVGIVSIVPLACCSVLGIIAGAAAAVLGWLGMQKANQGLATNRGQALAGLILGAIGFLISVASLILGIANVFDTPGYGF